MAAPAPSKSSTSPASTAIHVAIIGAGITGLTLGIGLHARGIPFTIYERAACLPPLGAGFGLSPNAERAMKLVDPSVHAAFKRAATPNGEDYFQWVNGHETGEVMFKLYVGKDGFEGCRRADFLGELVKLIPEGRLKFGMRVTDIVERVDGKAEVCFVDKESEVADVVVGCDGIHSRIRQLLLGSDPAASACYTNTFCFRTLVPRPVAEAALGKWEASTRFMYNGPKAHAITYPVGKVGEQLNILLVIRETEEVAKVSGPLQLGKGITSTAQGRRTDAEAAFTGWHPTVRGLASLLPEATERWNICDMFDYPAASYSKGAVCMAGDAAHAAGPHLGAGAGFGIEDALALATALAEVVAIAESGGHGDMSSAQRVSLIRDALQVYSDVRYDRTQWLVRHTREAEELFQWRVEGSQSPEVFGREITWRFHKIWEYDLEGMVQEVRSCLREKTSRVDG